jgi:hypothetical protein
MSGAVGRGSATRTGVLSIRMAGYLAILYGLFGVMSGVVAASTFYYFQSISDFPSAATGPLTVIAAAGAVVCGLAVVAGWALLRARSWAWRWTVGTSVLAVGTVAALIAFWPTRWGFLVFVALAYAALLGLLWWGHPAYEVELRRPVGA